MSVHTDWPTITVIVFQQGRLWVAQCLEVNIAVSAETRSAIPKMLRKRLQGQMVVDRRRGIALFSRFGQARRHYWELLDRAEPWMTQDVPEPLIARFLRAIKHLDGAGQRLYLAQVGVRVELQEPIETERATACRTASGLNAKSTS